MSVFEARSIQQFHELRRAFDAQVEAVIGAHMLWAPKLWIRRPLADQIIRYDVVLNDGRVFEVTVEWSEDREIQIRTRETRQ